MDIVTRANSLQVFPQSFELFTAPMTDIGVTYSDYIQLFPLNPLTDPTNPITFVFQGSHHYVDLQSAFLQIECKITNSDDSALKSTDNVSVIEDLAAGIFCNAEFLLQSYPVFRSSPLYPFTNHFANLVGFSDSEKNSALSAGLWKSDEGKDFLLATDNAGFKARKKLTELSKTFDIIRKPFISMFDCSRPLIPNTDFTITYFRSPDPFVLVGSAPATISTNASQALLEGNTYYKLHITKCILNLKRLVLLDNIVKKHRTLSSSGHPYLYPFKHCEAKPFVITKGSLEFQSELIFSQTLPETIAVCLVSQSAANGSLTTNPFLFAPNQLSSISILVEGTSTISRTISFGNTGDQLVMGFYSLMQAAGAKGIGINRQNYKSKCIVAFDLATSRTPNTFQPVRKSTIRLDFKFHSATTENYVAIVWSQWDTIISLDGRDKTVNIDSLLM